MLPHNQIPVIPFGRKTLEVRGSSQSMVSGGTGCPFVPFLAMFPLIDHSRRCLDPHRDEKQRSSKAAHPWPWGYIKEPPLNGAARLSFKCSKARTPGLLQAYILISSLTSCNFSSGQTLVILDNFMCKHSFLSLVGTLNSGYRGLDGLIPFSAAISLP